MGKMIALDVGGTFIKYACFVDGRMESASCGQFPINEKGSREEILDPIRNFLLGQRADAVCISIPGPMDYPTGTSRMRHKFVSLLGFPMKACFQEALPGVSVDFVHDGVAFLAGALALGEGGQAKRPAGVMLGTGLGFAMAEEGRILINEVNTPCPPLWNMPYREGIAEDYVSGRAIRAFYARESGQTADVREIAQMARDGNALAARVLWEAGRALGEMMQRRKEQLGIDLVILGGQISKAADVLLPAARQETDVDFHVTAYPDRAALYGAYAYSVKGGALVKRVPA